MAQTAASGMTSRQRLLTALRCEEPDRVPFLEAWVGEQIALALLGKPQPGQQEEPYDGTSADQGPVYVGTRPLSSPHYEVIDVVQTLGLDGFGTYLSLQGVRLDANGDYIVAGQRVKTRADLSRLRLPDPDKPTLYDPFRHFIAQYRDSGLALYCRVSPGASALIFGMGLESFSYALYDDRGMIEDLLDLYCDWYACAMRHLCQLDFDFIWSGEDIAFKSGPFISPKMFRELLMPRYRRVAEQITKPWIYHSDGNLLPILDDLLDLGLSGLHPIEPGSMDLAELKRRYGGRLCLCGRIDLDTLSQGTPQQVIGLVKEAIEIAAPGGGYIAGSSNTITDYCQLENVRAMQRAISDYGHYPIQ